jgi:hypothetical protein
MIRQMSQVGEQVLRQKAPAAVSSAIIDDHRHRY